MRLSVAAWALGFVSLIVADRAAASDPGIDWCRAPEEIVRADSHLPYVAEAIEKGQPIRIVVLGTMSSAGTGAGVTAIYQSYPEKLREELSRRYTRAPVTLVNLAQRGWTAVDMAAAIESKVIPLKPTVVIWQTGSVEAVRGLDVNLMGEAIGSGITLLHDNRSDVVLIDPQYNPHATAIIKFEPYAEYMQRIADSLDVILFNRHGIMKYWVEAGIVKFDNASRVMQRLNADQVHGCLGLLLADIVDRAAQRASGGTGTASPR